MCWRAQPTRPYVTLQFLDRRTGHDPSSHKLADEVCRQNLKQTPAQDKRSKDKRGSDNPLNQIGKCHPIEFICDLQNPRRRFINNIGDQIQTIKLVETYCIRVFYKPGRNEK